jgi:hypothetical protein
VARISWADVVESMSDTAGTPLRIHDDALRSASTLGDLAEHVRGAGTRGADMRATS